MEPRLEMMILPLLLKASILRMVTATGCSYPLGMESRNIGDDQLTASSFWRNVQDWHPREARLRNSKAWYPNSYATNEWLQVDLLKRTSITGIQTQGHWHSKAYFASSFKIKYSDNGTNWVTFQETGSDKVFEGNYEGSYNSVKTNDINPAIQARFIRVNAETWPWWSGFAFRLELLGCELLSQTTMRTTTNATTAFTTTQKQTTQNTLLTSYPMTSTKATTEIVTPTVPQRSTSPVNTVSKMTSPSSNNTSGNSDELAGNQTGTASGALIGGVVVAGVVVLIVAIAVSIFFVRRRRDTGDKNPSPQPDETGTVDNIYYGGVRFAANGNASTDGNVSIDQSGGMVDNDLYAYAGTTNGDVMIDQSEGMVDNNLYAGTPNGNAVVDQSEGTVNNHLYAATGDTQMGPRHHDGDDSAQDNVYYNVAHTSEEGSVENDIYC